MRIFPQTYNDKTTGKKKRAAKWYIEFRDHNQTVRRIPTFRDKAMADQFKRRLKILVEYRTNGERLDTDMMRWLETIPAPLRDKLAGYDLLDARSVAATRELMDHLGDFKRSLEAKGTSAKQAQQVYNRVKRVFDGCRFTSWSDISGSAIQIRSITIDGQPILLKQPGAELWTFPDHPAVFDAWDIDRPTLSNGQRLDTPAKRSVESRGTLTAAVCFQRKIGRSSVVTVRYRRQDHRTDTRRSKKGRERPAPCGTSLF